MNDVDFLFLSNSFYSLLSLFSVNTYEASRIYRTYDGSVVIVFGSEKRIVTTLDAGLVLLSVIANGYIGVISARLTQILADAYPLEEDRDKEP